MAVAIISETDDPVAWTRALQAHMAELETRVWPELGQVEDVDVALAWGPPPGALQSLPNLKLIVSLGAGVDHLFGAAEPLPNVPITRLVDDNLISQMSEYVCCAVLRYHRRMDDYQNLQRQRRWQRLPPPNTARRTVGILGLGEIGRDAADKLMALGFTVTGWSRTPKSLAGVESFSGSGGLRPFLQNSNILACLLPLTPATENLINAEILAMLPQGAYLINCARGGHVVDEALLAALDSGHIAGATLDVFRQEPLPPEHPFWSHPKVQVTPHIAGVTNPETAAAQIVDNIRRVRSGLPVLNRIDPQRGY